MFNIDNLTIISRTYSGFNISVLKHGFYIRDVQILELVNKCCSYKNSPHYLELCTYFPDDVIILCDATEIIILYGVNHGNENK